MNSVRDDAGRWRTRARPSDGHRRFAAGGDDAPGLDVLEETSKAVGAEDGVESILPNETTRGVFPRRAFETVVIEGGRVRDVDGLSVVFDVVQKGGADVLPELGREVVANDVLLPKEDEPGDDGGNDGGRGDVEGNVLRSVGEVETESRGFTHAERPRKGDGGRESDAHSHLRQQTLSERHFDATLQLAARFVG